MSYTGPSAVEIDRKLREDFRRRLKDFGLLAETTDPVLAVLFRTFAQEMERLYSETDRIRLSLLDEFMAGLQIQSRMARPAQSILRFFPDQGAFLGVPGGAELNGQAVSGERLTFTTDSFVQVSGARISLGATYQEGCLQLLPGIDMPDELQAARPSLDPIRAQLGPHPALYLALENLPPSHLSGHSIFFEFGSDSPGVEEALQSEPWCVVGSNGELSGLGLLRPQRSNAGLRRLEWLVAAANPDDAVAQEVPELPDGFYSGRVFIFPHVPVRRRFSCAWPKLMAEPLMRVFGRNAREVFSQPRVWLRISMPESLPSLNTALITVSLHAMTVSNVECLNQTVRFKEQGTSVPVSREAGAKKHLVKPLSVLGELNVPYLSELEISSDHTAGRYSFRQGRIILQPATRPGGEPEAYANLRLWVTDGSVANTVGPGQIRGFAKTGPFDKLRLTNPVAAAGGTDGESYGEANARFAEVLLSRDRIVTEADLMNAIRAFDRRIVHAVTRPGVARTRHGLHRVQRVSVGLDRNAFVDADTELVLFRQEITQHLNQRLLHGIDLDLSLEWK